MTNFIRANFAWILTLAAAAFFRFWQIWSLPGGLFPDEAANGIDANAILGGDLQPFYERGNGRGALFFYFIALVIKFFGRGPWQHHVVSAFFGLLTVFVTYYLVKRMFGKYPALLSAFLLGVSSYAATLSRTAFRAITIPFFTALTFFFLVKFFDSRDNKTKLWSAALAGASFALGFYTYIAYRMMIPILGFLLVVLLYSARNKLRKVWKNYAKYLLVSAAAFVIAFGPLGYYFISHPGSFVGRAGQVSIFSPELNEGDVIGTFFEVFDLTMKSFFTDGDLNWRHNVSGFPFLPPIVSVFFAISLILFTVAVFQLIYQAHKKKIEKITVYKALVAIWFWAMLVPEVTTAEGIPHGLRLIGVIPPLFIMPAWSMYEGWKILKKHSKYVLFNEFVAAALLGGIFIYNFYLYFGITANSAANYYAYRSDLTSVSHYLNERNMPAKTYLSLDKFSVQTVDYLTTKTNQPYVLLDPANTFAAQLADGDQVVFTMSTLFDRIKFLEHHPDAELVYTEKNKWGEIVMLIYQK